MRLKNTKLHILHCLSALMLCLLLVAGLLPTTASAAEGNTGGLRWQLSGGILTISGSGPMPNYTDANLPPWYASADAISRIVVKEGVTSIGNLAFYGCSKATGVSLAPTVTSIGSRAFKNCSSIAYIGFPAGLTSIGEAAFESCERLNGIMLPSGLQSVGNYAFSRCIRLTHITIPASVTKLGMVTFAYCKNLTQAVILCPMTKLPDWTFYGCTALSSVSIPETVTEIGDKAFQNCGNLSNIYYSGNASDSIDEALQQDASISNVTIVENGQPSSQISSSVFDEASNTEIVTNISITTNASITKVQEKEYSFIVNGKPATMEEALTAGENDDVEINSNITNMSVTATIWNKEGWEELDTVVSNALDRVTDKQENIYVNVQLTNSTIDKSELERLAGKDITLSISTGGGSTWIVDQSIQSGSGFGQENYNLDFSVTKLDQAPKGIASNTVYQMEVPNDVDFSAFMGVNLKVGDSRQYATLYQKDRNQMTELQTVMVDDNGRAWFALANVDAGVEYYIGINVENVDTQNALIPDSLKSDYGVEHTLMDIEGTQYKITGRASRWGITGMQYAIYAGIAIGAVVLVVSGVMVTMNKIQRSKMRYVLVDEQDDSLEIDEEAIRLQVMQEMLEEAQKRDKQGKE